MSRFDEEFTITPRDLAATLGISKAEGSPVSVHGATAEDLRMAREMLELALHEKYRRQQGSKRRVT